MPDDKTRGLYGKYLVDRTDGQSSPGAKHYGCRYFVLDVTHDPIALAALAQYEREARRTGYAALADDLRVLLADQGLPVVDHTHDGVRVDKALHPHDPNPTGRDW